MKMKVFSLCLTAVFLISCQSSPTIVTTPPATQAVNSLTVPATATQFIAAALSPTPPPPVIIEPIETTTISPTNLPEKRMVPPEPVATAVIAGLIGPDNFPPGINPLTGELVSNPDLLNRRPLAIKVSNAPAIVRPQSGLNNADLVFEHYAEGGLTRFTAVFYSKDVDPAGSIRSARLIDLEIPKMYDAGFAYSGASGPVRLMIRDSDFFERVVSPDFAHGGFFRVEDPNKAFEHTLFTNTYNIRAILAQRGENSPPRLAHSMAFRSEPIVAGQPVTQVEIGYSGTYVTWVYNAGSGRYTRWTDGNTHLDANTGDPLNFKNIIVLAAHHENTDILEDYVGGGNYSIQIQIWGEGPVSVFRDGQRIDGRWRRDDPTHMLTFYDQTGNIMALAPGNSFFQLVPLGFDRLYTTP